MANITLRQLRYFEALARFAHFGHAAEAVAISQPALSVQIKELEATLGLPLFERGARQVRLTAFGEEFAPRVRQILAQVDELANLAQAAGEGLAGRLRLGVIPTIAPYLLPRIVTRLTQSHPELDLHIRESLTPRLIEELHEGRIDAALVALPISEPGFEEVALFSEELLLVRPKAEADLPLPSPEALREMRLLLLEEGHCFRDQALSFCDMRGPGVRERLDGSSLATLVQMVGAGLGVTLIPEMAVAVETRAVPVAVARFAAPRPERVIGLIFRRSNPMAGQLREMAEMLRFSPRG